MKLGLSMMIATASVSGKTALFRAPKGTDDKGRKVNGKHPQRRLQSINKFMCGWLGDNLESKMGDRICNRFTKMIFNYNDVFSKDQCSYFDPMVKHGGPHPDPAMHGVRPAKNPNAKKAYRQRRVRRDDDDESDEDEEALLDTECDGSETDEKLIAVCKAGSEKRTVSVNQRQLKRYTTAMMKWCNRFIYDCYGQRVHNHCLVRVKNIFDKLMAEISE